MVRGGGEGEGGEERTLHRSTCVHSPDDTVREASCRALVRSTHSTAPRVRVRWSYWACVLAETNSSARCLQPSQSSLRPRTFPPRRKNCPPRSRGASAARHRCTGTLRRGASSTSRGRSVERSTVVDVPRGWTQGGRYGVRERTEVRQDLIGSGAGDCLGAGRTVAPRNAKRRKPACWNARVVTPTRESATPSIHGHEDTDRTTPRDGSLYIRYRKYRWLQRADRKEGLCYAQRCAV